MGRGSRAGGVRRCRFMGMVGWLVVVAVSIVVAAPPVETRAERAAIVAVPQLNVRSAPGTAAPIVGQVWEGERLALLDGPAADDWYRIQAGDRIGWAYGGGLAIDGGGDATAPGKSTGVGGERWVDVDRTTQMVTLYDGQSAIAAFWAAMGSDPSDDGFFATALGTYYVYEKTEGLSWSDWGGAWIGDWVGFDPQRLNGFHTYSMDATGGVLPGGDGPTGGCVALVPPAADQLFAFVSVGTRIEVHR